MRNRIATLCVCVATCIAAFTMMHDSRGQNDNAPAATQNDHSAQQGDTERGRYIVHHVAMCIYCHTPRDDRGTPDEHQLLHGAPMPVESPFPGQKWAFMAPKIAGLPGGWSEKEMTRFLQTGDTPTGHKPLPPMPPFRFHEDDARAVAAYLKSLP